MSRRIIQFGTSRFLQAHFDLFVHEARLSGQDIGPISVVKTTEGGLRDQRIAALGNSAGFPVRIRGMSSGVAVDHTIMVTSVDSAFTVREHWPDILRVFADDAEIAVSNVGETGYELSPLDRAAEAWERVPPQSFPAKLLALLLARYRRGGGPLLFIPTELKPSNGQLLAALVLGLAKDRELPRQFLDWLTREVVFADTLVDRIVAEAIEPVGAVTEPYALLAVRRGPFVLPLVHPAVRLVDDLESLERLKLHVLNLGHSIMADIWFTEQRLPGETVRAFLDDARVERRVLDVYRDEIMPGFAARGMGHMAADYLGTTLERFRNPFLEHRLSDIASNHRAKVLIRAQGFVNWVEAADPGIRLPYLKSLAKRANEHKL